MENVVDLPKFVLASIFELADPIDILAIERVCKQWKDSAASSPVWKVLLELESPLNSICFLDSQPRCMETAVNTENGEYVHYFKKRIEPKADSGVVNCRSIVLKRREMRAKVYAHLKSKFSSQDELLVRLNLCGDPEDSPKLNGTFSWIRSSMRRNKSPYLKDCVTKITWHGIPLIINTHLHIKKIDGELKPSMCEECKSADAIIIVYRAPYHTDDCEMLLENENLSEMKKIAPNSSVILGYNFGIDTCETLLHNPQVLEVADRLGFDACVSYCCDYDIACVYRIPVFANLPHLFDTALETFFLKIFRKLQQNK